MHPYRSLPEKAFWRKSVSGVAVPDVDPVGEFRLRIDPQTKVATAGSCFAQHIARHLQKSGFHYYVTEPGHALLPEELRKEQHYGLFTARNGNIYTSRQLKQLVQRAYGDFLPAEQPWRDASGNYLDPFRPTTQVGGYAGIGELLADREQHFTAVRKMIETLDVFVFTLGLTECWASRCDGAVFPLCPGVEGGEFSHEAYQYLNLGVQDVIDDMTAFWKRLKSLNPKAQMVLTVSPVPLMATAEPNQHVLAATTYSKSVLRVAAESLRLAHEDIHYFPSFEIITGAYNRGQYYGEDLRNVTEQGVAQVMRLFLKHAARHVAVAASPAAEASSPAPISNAVRAAQLVADVECDEAALDRPEGEVPTSAPIGRRT